MSRAPLSSRKQDAVPASASGLATAASAGICSAPGHLARCGRRGARPISVSKPDAIPDRRKPPGPTSDSYPLRTGAASVRSTAWSVSTDSVVPRCRAGRSFLGKAIPVCARVVQTGLSLRVATLGVAGQPVVWDRLPRRSVGDELADAGPDPGIAVERSDANADRIGVVRVAAKQRRATVAAEPLLATAVRFHARSLSSPATIRKVSGAGWAFADAAAPLRRWQRLQWQ